MRVATFAAAVLAATASSACSHGAGSEPAATTGSDSGKVGYVNMDALVKVHPLYPQLAHLDEDVQALQLRSVGAQIANAGADISQAEAHLQRELDAAAARTRSQLADKQREYSEQEQAAIAAALKASQGGGSGGSIAQSVQSEARRQAQDVARAAQANLQTYRGELVDQERTAAATLARTLDAQATREYRAHAAALARDESDYALRLAGDDAAQRLSLRTKLSNLALDDATRANVTAQLSALDRKESDALAAMKNRDQSALAAFDVQLHARVRAKLAQQLAALRTRTTAKLDARELQTRSEIVAQTGVPATGGAVPAGAGPNLKRELQTLHARFQTDFNRDAAQTVAQFQKTRADLTRRFRALAGADAADRSSAQRQIDALQKQRSDLYGQMVAQIDREVKAIAQKRGIEVVVDNEIAPAGGVDLTAEAQKDIESLHE